MNNHALLTKFKQKAREIEPMQSKELDFPFTKFQLALLKTEEKRTGFLNSILLTAEEMANKIFTNVDEKLILFFAAYLFVYQQPRSNFRLPDFNEIPILDQDVPDEVHQIENENIQFGLYETAKNVKSNAAFFFCYEFTKDLNAYSLKESEFSAEDLLAKIGAPFIIDDVETCKKFMVFDSRRPASEPRLFLFDVSAGHIEALKIKNPIGTSYEYDDNFMAYDKHRGTFKLAKIDIGCLLMVENDMFRVNIPLSLIESNLYLEEKLSACEKFIFI